MIRRLNGYVLQSYLGVKMDNKPRKKRPNYKIRGAGQMYTDASTALNSLEGQAQLEALKKIKVSKNRKSRSS